MSKEFFSKKSVATPTIYAYKLPNDGSRKGQLKVGFYKFRTQCVHNFILAYESAV